mmetsp:Transcript_43040/g.103775  ORF Transcript_43040/g.103775 Transcript_43040/m.103775 type:complete len:206 (-) Transcript_43040:1524-2141(-)
MGGAAQSAHTRGVVDPLWEERQNSSNLQIRQRRPSRVIHAEAREPICSVPIRMRLWKPSNIHLPKLARHIRPGLLLTEIIEQRPHSQASGDERQQPGTVLIAETLRNTARVKRQSLITRCARAALGQHRWHIREFPRMELFESPVVRVTESLYLNLDLTVNAGGSALVQVSIRSQRPSRILSQSRRPKLEPSLILRLLTLILITK